MKSWDHLYRLKSCFIQMLLAGYPIPTTTEIMVKRRKSSWSGELHQNGSTTSFRHTDSGNITSTTRGSNKSLCKTKTIVLVGSTSSASITSGRLSNKGVKVKRSNSLFNINVLNKNREKKNNNDSNESCGPTKGVCFWRRLTCSENLYSQNEKSRPKQELKKSAHCEVLSSSSEKIVDNPDEESVERFWLPSLDLDNDACTDPDSGPIDCESPDADSMTALMNNSGHPVKQSGGSRGGKEFVPTFILVDACKETNERKIKELVKRLSCVSSSDLEPVVNYQDPTGRTALSYACGSGNITIIEELSKLRRLDPNLPDNEGNTPLHYASQAGHSEAVDLMLSRFEGVVDPNCRNSTGLTPLMKAALQGRTRCAKSLITAGASPHVQDYSRGLTAIEWARLCGRHICAEVIVRSVKDTYKHPGSPPPSLYSNSRQRAIAGSQSSVELKRINSDDSPYHNLFQARSTVSGATWLKNKIKKALGATGTNPSSMPKSSSLGSTSRPRMDTNYALMSNLGGATICASSLLLPSIKPILDQHQKPRTKKKLAIPTLQVTPVNKR